VCHQAWPDGSTNGVQKYGEYGVSVLQATKQDGFVECIISITDPQVMEQQKWFMAETSPVQYRTSRRAFQRGFALIYLTICS